MTPQRVLLLACFLATAVAGQRARLPTEAPVVLTEQGWLVGTVEKSHNGMNYFAYKGIRFAKPPVGDLRFKAPVPLPPGSHIINATMDGPMCMQKNYLLPTPAVFGQEDCLYLNVYTLRANIIVKLPVMVYIHGGGWFTGTGASYFNGPEYFMDRNIVLVTFNYRLGALGFLSTGDAHAPGNYAMKDQVAALKWVKKNILEFGGDPNLVTIFGQSAGAASVHYHMLSPLSQGLFHTAISQSGTALSPWAWPGETLSVAQQQAKFVGCPHKDSATMIECLRRVDATTLTHSGDNFHFWSIDPLTTFVPVLETSTDGDAFMTQDPISVIQSGKFAKVPWIVGIVAQEGIIRGLPIVSDEALLADLNSRWSSLGPKLFEIEKSVGAAQIDSMWANITKFYLNDSLPIKTDNALGFINMYSDRSFVHGLHKSALLHAAQGHNTIYMYLFDYPGTYSYADLFAMNPTKYGTSHCDDLIYLFRVPILFPDWPRDHPDVKVKDSLLTVWTNFAKLGKPTPSAMPVQKISCELFTNNSCDLTHLAWSPVKSVSSRHVPLYPPYLLIKKSNDSLNRPTLDFGMENELFKERMDFWDSAPLVENSVQNLQCVHPRRQHTVHTEDWH